MGAGTFEGALSAPGVPAGNPARYVPAILVIIRAEHFPECLLFVELHEQNNGNGSYRHHQQCRAARPAKHNPQSDPADEKTHVHWVSYIAIKSDHHQPLRRNKWRRRSASRSAKIPNAAQGHGKTQHRGHGSDPSPFRRTSRRNIKSQPARQQPEPQREETGTHGQRGNGCEPLRAI
jgi:hypothetical protein